MAGSERRLQPVLKGPLPLMAILLLSVCDKCGPRLGPMAALGHKHEALPEVARAFYGPSLPFSDLIRVFLSLSVSLDLLLDSGVKYSWRAIIL